jgi:preprotein translocase subunit SecF
MTEENTGQKEKPKTEEQKKTGFRFNYDRHYKPLLLIPIIILLLSLVYLGIFYSKNGDIIDRDVSLSGGTSITINGEIDQNQLEAGLREKFPDISFTKLEDITSRKEIALIVESSASPEELKPEIENILGYKLNAENSSTEFTGAALSQNFYRQLITALIISFILMSIVIFILFRTFIPSIAIILAAFSDMVIALAVINLLDVRIGTAGIAAFLMLIGYSVDTDILLTVRVLKRKEGSVMDRIVSSIKTGMTMTITAIISTLVALLVTQSEVIRQIMLILLIGLIADIFNTWIQNVGLLRIYIERKSKKGIQI